jgi:hypothetical protein
MPCARVGHACARWIFLIFSFFRRGALPDDQNDNGVYYIGPEYAALHARPLSEQKWCKAPCRTSQTVASFLDHHTFDGHLLCPLREKLVHVLGPTTNVH